MLGMGTGERKLFEVLELEMGGRLIRHIVLQREF
jgi:hypothetical protein